MCVCVCVCVCVYVCICISQGNTIHIGLCVYIYIYTHTCRGFPGGSVGKESTHSAEDLGSILGLQRSSGGGHGNPLQYSCLEKPNGQRSLAGCSSWVANSQT